ncbi:DUF4365 domain-containing protein [Microbacterium sp. NPDC087589]|uniref:DUF4365 domain-containing protein n=1 Tax=Microbacterium sp. NPDC087589 TaxID=3364191 RepID=UPI0038130A20
MTVKNSERERVGRLAVSFVEQQVIGSLKWLFRAQEVSDHGIDAHIETMDADDKPTGKLVAAQIKGGDSAFKSPTSGGWHFPVKPRHAKYWLASSLPVVLILVDVRTGSCYWQIVNKTTLTSTGKGFKVLVPEAHDLREAGHAWESFTIEYSKVVEQQFEYHGARLSPEVRKHLQALREQHYYAAGALASDLVAGREDPTAAVRELLRSRSEWLDAHGRNAWLAVLTFCLEHENHDAASTVLQRLADVDPDSRGAYLANAAVQVMDSDPDLAHRLGHQAREISPDDTAVHVANALLGYDVEHAEQRLTGRSDVLSHSYFATKALHNGDDTEAIRRLELVVGERPESVNGYVRLAQALLRRSHTPHAETSDQTLAESHLRTALSLHRSWSDHTADTLEVLLVALASQSKYADLIKEASLPPMGTATPPEATDPTIRYLARQAALRVGRPDIVPADDQDRPRESREDQIAAYRHQVTQGRESGDNQRVFAAVLQLAVLGVDAVADVQEVPTISDEQRNLLSVVAQAGDRDDKSLPALRGLARTHMLAAEIVLDILRRRDTSTAAIAAADQYFGIYKSASFLMTKAWIHLNFNEREDAIAVLTSALIEGRLAGEDKRSAHLLLGEYHAEKSRWKQAIEHFRAAVDENPFTTERPVWSLAQCYTATGETTLARRLLDTHQHVPDNENDMELWALIHSQTGWDEVTATQAITFAEAEERTPALAFRLAGNVFGATSSPRAQSEEDESDPEMDELLSPADDLRPLVSGDLHSRALRLMTSLQEKYGEMFGRTISGTTEEAVEQIVSVLAESRDPERDRIAREVVTGNAPQGLLCELKSDPYGLILASRYENLRIASYADGERHALETAAAQRSIGGDIIIDLSAIDLALELGVWDSIYADFNVITIPSRIKRDAIASAAQARRETAPGGSIHMDADGKMWGVSSDVARARAIFERCEEMVQVVDTLQTSRSSPSHLPEEIQSLGDSAWTTALALSIETGRPLWADDLALRQVAAEAGVETFGTVNILEARNLAQLENASSPEQVNEAIATQAQLIATLVEHRVADQPVTVEEVIASIRRHPNVLAPAADILRRGPWWQDAGSIEPWEQIIEEVRAHSPSMVREWQARAIIGICEAMPGETAVPVVTTLVALGTAESPSVDDVIEGIQLADAIARSRKLPLRPSTALPVVAKHLELCEEGGTTEQFVHAIIERLEKDRSDAEDQPPTATQSEDDAPVEPSERD